MKSPSNPDLEAIREEAAAIEPKVQLLEDELGGKLKDGEALKAAAEKKAAKLRAEYEDLKSDYTKAWAQVEADERKAIETKALLLKDVEAGQASMSEYLKSGQDAAQIAVQARAEADRKMSELANLVRAKALAVVEAEAEIADAEFNLVYLYSAPGILLVENYKEFIKRAEARVAMTRGGWPAAMAKRDEARNRVERCRLGVRAEGRTWRDMDEKGLRELRLDPEIPDAWLPELDKAIASIAGTGERVDVIGRHGLHHRGQVMEFVGNRVPHFDKTSLLTEAEVLKK